MVKFKSDYLFSRDLNFKEQISICAHDAGAANHILEIFKKNFENSKLCLRGPAYELFSKFSCNINNLSIENCLLGSNYLISGTGWESNIEHEARKIAAKNGIFNIAILDHWVNYLERFQRDKETVLPDEIWVTDDEAFRIASKVFNITPIRKIPNFLYKEITQKVKLEKSSNLIGRNKQPPKRLLYLTEPIRNNWNNNELGEFQALKYFFKNLEKLSKNFLISPKQKIEKIFIKLHPSEEIDKYDGVISSIKSDIPISVTKMDLHRALAWCESTFGCETQALAISLACEIPTFSTIPPWGNKCRLPHSKIIHIKDI